MCKYLVAVHVMFFDCCFTYHALLELHYSDKWDKSAGAKKQAQAEGISMWKAE